MKKHVYLAGRAGLRTRQVSWDVRLSGASKHFKKTRDPLWPETLVPTESNVSHMFSNSLSQMEPCHLKYDQNSTISGSLQEENLLIINYDIIG